MQVTSNPIPEKQTGLEGQVRNREIPTPNRTSIQTPKFDEKGSEKGATQNETSQYLKVLSRVENLLIQNKLPDAAIEGFAGAVKKQIDSMTEAERHMLLKLPELKILELDDLNDVPEMIKNDIRNEEKSPALLKFLRIPEFADLMRTDNKPEPKTYTAQSASHTSNVKNEGKILSDSAEKIEKPIHSSPAKLNQGTNQNINLHVKNQTI